MAVSSIGVGSGLPLEDLLRDLRNSENTALALIQSKQVTAENRLSAYGKIQSAIEAMQTAGKNLAKADTYGALKTTVSSDAFTASASTKAIAGKYTITVESLATSQTLVTQGVADRATANGTGGIVTFTLGDGTEKTLDLTGKDTSIDGLIKAINEADPSLGIRATVVNDGSDDPHRLLLTTEATGTEAAVTNIAVVGNSDLNTLIGFNNGEATGVTQEAATDAKLKINGIDITSHNNEVKDAIEGVTLTLSKVSTDPVTMTVARDDSVATQAINAFVTAYNNLQNTIKSLTSYNVESQQSSALTGDTLARRAQTQMRDLLNVVGSEGTVRSMSQLGITTDHATGLLKVDNDTLSKALKENLTDVKNLLSGENGLSSRIASTTDVFLRSDGLISAAKEGADRHIKDLRDQYDATSARIDARMENYRRQFTALDGMVAQMNSISTYLTQQLSMLGNLAKDSK